MSHEIAVGLSGGNSAVVSSGGSSAIRRRRVFVTRSGRRLTAWNDQGKAPTIAVPRTWPHLPQADAKDRSVCPLGRPQLGRVQRLSPARRRRSYGTRSPTLGLPGKPASVHRRRASWPSLHFTATTSVSLVLPRPATHSAVHWLSERTVQRSLSVSHQGLISRTKRYRSGGWRTSDSYVLHTEVGTVLGVPPGVKFGLLDGAPT